eukprot:tig00001335_g8206.t1
MTAAPAHFRLRRAAILSLSLVLAIVAVGWTRDWSGGADQSARPDAFDIQRRAPRALQPDADEGDLTLRPAAPPEPRPVGDGAGTGASDEQKRAELAQFVTSTMSGSARRAPDLDPQICDDFYEAACGGWLPRAKIPDGADSFSLHDDTVAARVSKISLAIAERGGDPVVGPYFAACADRGGVEAAGAGPLRALVHFVLLSETFPSAFEVPPPAPPPPPPRPAPAADPHAGAPAVGRGPAADARHPALWGAKVQARAPPRPEPPEPGPPDAGGRGQFDGKMRNTYALVL